MTDERLSPLFAEGTAPERDPAFMLGVAEGIGRARLRMRLLALALRVTVVLMLAVVLFVAGRLLEPMLTPVVEGLPRFMGVPVPVVLLGLIVAGLALRGWFHPSALRRFAAASVNGN